MSSPRSSSPRSPSITELIRISGQRAAVRDSDRTLLVDRYPSLVQDDWMSPALVIVAALLIGIGSGIAISFGI